MFDYFDFEGDGWFKIVVSVKSNLEEDVDVVEIKKLKQEVEELKKMIEGLIKFIVGEKGFGNGDIEELKGFDEEGEFSGGVQGLVVVVFFMVVWLFVLLVGVFWFW